MTFTYKYGFALTMQYILVTKDGVMVLLVVLVGIHFYWRV